MVLTVNPQLASSLLFLFLLLLLLPYGMSGSVLALPAGLFKADASSPAVNATYLYARGEW